MEPLTEQDYNNVRGVVRPEMTLYEVSGGNGGDRLRHGREVSFVCCSR